MPYELIIMHILSNVCYPYQQFTPGEVLPSLLNIYYACREYKVDIKSVIWSLEDVDMLCK
jgi:hypothetical protein